jgi:uncharacterized membrane-anchored protein
MKNRLLIAVVTLQILWIAGTIGSQEFKHHQGTLAHLRAYPVDPRDLLRGDYLVLRYDVSQLSDTLFDPPLTQALTAGTPVSVVLELRDGTHQAVRASAGALDGEPGQIILRGTASSSLSLGNTAVTYGLERFYVREGTGNPHGTLTAEVAIPQRGSPALKDLLLNDVPYAEAMKHVKIHD